MAAEIKTLPDGREALVITNPGNHIEIYSLDVIASYSELLGEPDPAKTIILIRGCMATKDQAGMWAPLYENLHAGLGELVKAGVPPEHMPDVLQADTGSPIPGREKAAAMRAAQAAVRTRVSKGISQNTTDFAAVLAAKADSIKAQRAGFLQTIAPRRPEPAPPVQEPPLSRMTPAVGRPSAKPREGTHGND